jgi:hypothetical protein
MPTPPKIKSTGSTAIVPDVGHFAQVRGVLFEPALAHAEAIREPEYAR